MSLTIEQINSDFYIDVVFTERDLLKMHHGEMVMMESHDKEGRVYVGARLRGAYEYEKGGLIWEDEDKKSHERI